MAALQDPDKGLPVAEKPEAQTGKTKPAFHYSKFAHSWWQRLFFINTDPLVRSVVELVEGSRGVMMLKKLTVPRCRFTMPTAGGGWSKRWVRGWSGWGSKRELH
jgi:hypothetical protein